MSDNAPPLSPGPVPHTNGWLDIAKPLGRVGDGLVYVGHDGNIPARLREYAPPGIVMRATDGALEPADHAYAGALDAARIQFIALGKRLAELSHPGIAAVWRTETTENSTAWLIGAPTGASLKDGLDAGLVFTAADVARFAGELADVLAELHGQGVAHLDIAPETVSIASGQVQLSDFAVDNRPFIALLHGHDDLVRPGYSAIEHYDAGMEEPLGPPADVHAASALVYRLATGRTPAPWQERWRNPDAAPLPDRDDYPPGFLAAIARGMAIEPDDRFANGAEWRAALNLPARPAPLPAIIPERRRSAIGPALVAFGLLVIAALGFLVWRSGWLTSDPVSNTTNISIAGSDNVQVPPPERIAPQIRAGDTVEGQLAADDATGPDGGYRDGFRLDAHRGDRVAIQVRANGFAPLLSLFGPGLAGQQGEDGRITITLPQDGTYTLLVGAAQAGAGGAYTLEVVPAPAEIPQPDPVDPAAARRLAGSWHSDDDDSCESPAVNSVEGHFMTVELNGQTYRHRIDAAGAGVVNTTIQGGRLDGRRFHFRPAGDGDSYDMDGETWTRC